MSSKTLDPALSNVNLFYKKEFYSKASNFLSTIQNYSKELEYGIKYNLTKVQNDTVTAQKNLFIELDSAMKRMSPQFAAAWIEKFNNSLIEVKNQVRIKIGEGTFYRSFSDSIGGLARIEGYIDDSLQLVSDIQGSSVLSPLRYGTSLTNKMSPAALLLHTEMSKKTNIVFRKNIQNIQDTIQGNTTAQGGNLNPDTEHFKRMKAIIPTLQQNIQQEFKELYNVIYYFCTYNSRAGTNNLQFAPNVNITVNIEGNNLNQDLLFNQLKDVTSSLTSRGVLGAG
jgi:hypothetical protein